MGSITIPYLLQRVVGTKGTYVHVGLWQIFIGRGLSLSILEGIGAVVAVVWQPISGSLSDHTQTRFGRRKPYIVVGSLGDVLFLIGLALSGNFFLVCVFYFLLQIASNTAQGPYQGMLPDNVDEHERGRASGYYGLANLVGTGLGILVVGYLISQGRFDFAIGTCCVIVIAAMLATVFYVPETQVAVSARENNMMKALLDTFKLDPKEHKDFLLLLTSRLLILMGAVGLQSFAYFFIKDVFFPTPIGASAVVRSTLDNRAAGVDTKLMLMVLIFALLTTVPAGIASQHYGRKRIIISSAVIGSLATVVVLVAHSAVLPFRLEQGLNSLIGIPVGAFKLMLGAIMLGAALGSFLSVDWAYVVDLVPKAEAGKFMGLSNIATAGSGVIVRFVGGIVLDFFNRFRYIGMPGGYPVLFGSFLVFFVFGIIALSFVREPRAMLEMHPMN